MKELNLSIPSFIMIYCTVIYCTELKYNAPNCTVLHRAAQPHQQKYYHHFHLSKYISTVPEAYKSLVLCIIFILHEEKNFCAYKTKSPKTNYNIYEIMILLNNVTYHIHCILAHYIDVLCSAVKCSALHCSIINYNEFLFSSGKRSTLHLRAIYYNTCTHLH